MPIVTMSSLVSGIKSIQRGVVSPTGGATSGTITISSVNTAKAVTFCDDVIWNTAQAATVSLTLTNATTLTWTTCIAAQAGSSIAWQVLEFN